MAYLNPRIASPFRGFCKEIKLKEPEKTRFYSIPVGFSYARMMQRKLGELKELGG